MPTQIITPPTAEALTLAAVKLHLRVTDDAEDSLIVNLIISARQQAEMCLQRSLMFQTLELTLDAFPLRFELTLPPVQSVISIKYLDENGVVQTVDPSQYLLNDNIISLAYEQQWPATRPQTAAVTVQYTGGYADASAIPAPIKSAMLLLIGELYNSRENASADQYYELPSSAKMLLQHYRVLSY